MIDEEDVTAQLLRLAGAPSNPSVERTARVWKVVHREWRASRRRRTIRTSAATGLLGLAASLIVAVWLKQSPRPVVVPTSVVLATVQRVQGQPVVARARPRDENPRLLSASTSIASDDVIETDDGSRAALQTGDGSSVRIDKGSRVRFVAPSMLELLGGAVYVVTADGSHGFDVRTTLGVVRDVGTQFEVRLTGFSLQVRVRTGAVEINRDNKVTKTPAGYEAMVTMNGVAVRETRTYGSEWAWTSDVAPSFAIEGRPLRAFLQHIAVEEGWTLRYANHEIDNAAGQIILHGSIDGLSAEDALRATLTTSGMEYRLSRGELVVSRPGVTR